MLLHLKIEGKTRSKGLPLEYIDLNIRVLDILTSVLGDKLLSRREIVSKQGVEHTLGCLGVGGSYRNKTARGGIHRGLRHHLRLVFAKTL